MQIANDLVSFSKYIPGLQTVAVYGGAPIQNQIRQLRQGAQLVVATPGRLMDLIERESIDLSHVQFLILDEADEMLNMGFEEDVKHILSFTPKEKIVGLFSATMPAEIRNIAKNYLRNPIELSVGKKNSTQQNIEHRYCVSQLGDKYEALKRMLDYYPDFFGIIFCATKAQTQEISDQLVRDGYPADCLHGDLGQSQRDKVMNHFRHQTIRILLATDVAARGIDVSDLTHVIHYQLPQDIEAYTHRSGRTARAGKSGISIAMLLPRDQVKISRIERQIQAKLTYLPIPKAAEVRERKLAHLINTVALTEVDSSIQLDSIVETGIAELEKLSQRELILKILYLELRRFSTDYLSGADLNVYQGERMRKPQRTDDVHPEWTGNRERYSSNSGYEGGSSEGGDDSRIFISIGSVDKMRYDEMREFIFQATGVRGKRIKDIEMKDTYSFFNTDLQSAEAIYNAFKGDTVELKGRALRVDYAAGGIAGANGGNANGGGSLGGSKYKKEYGGKKEYSSNFSNRNGSRSSSNSSRFESKSSDRSSSFGKNKKPRY